MTKCFEPKGKTRNPLSEQELRDVCGKLDIAANSWSHAGCAITNASDQKN